MTTWSSASGSKTSSQTAFVPAIPWTRRITGPLPAIRYASLWPWRSTTLRSGSFRDISASMFLMWRRVKPQRADREVRETPPIADELATSDAPAPRGRPAGATRDAVLSAALYHYLRGQRVDVQALAAELGVGRTTIYRWFGSREQLLGEVVA